MSVPRRSWTWILLFLGAATGCGREVPRAERILLVTLDTTRADRLGCYGYQGGTSPVLDRLAREEGVLFEQAVAPTPTTLPSHSTIFTGLYPQDHGVRYNTYYQLAASVETLAERLKEGGYATAAFPASHVVGKRSGLDQGFDTWEEPPSPSAGGEGRNAASHPLGSMRRAGENVDLVLRWLDSAPRGPWFVWLHLYDPHWPYVPPFPFSSSFRDRPYEGEIAYADAQLGRLLDRLRAESRWDRTLVVVAGDHGEGLFEHGERYHAMLVYEATQRVPLIVRAPGTGPSRVKEPVSLADIAPTILDLAGLPPLGGPIRGISLTPALRGASLPRRDLYFESLVGAIVFGWAELKGVRVGDLKLIDSASPELFDLAEDPAEVSNTAAVEPARVEDLRRALAGVLQPLSGGGSVGDEAQIPVDPQTEAMLASLGYVSASTAPKSAVEDAPHPRDLVFLYPEVIEAQGAVARGQWSRVDEISRYVLAKDPRNRWALAGAAHARIVLGQPQEALAPARKLLEIAPEAEQAIALLAHAESASGRPKEALALLERGSEKLPNSELLAYLRLVAAFESAEPDVCETKAPAALSRFPESRSILVVRARCEARAGRAEAALASIEEAVRKGFDQVAGLRRERDFAEVVRLAGFARLETDAQRSASAASSGGPGSNGAPPSRVP